MATWDGGPLARQLPIGDDVEEEVPPPPPGIGEALSDALREKLHVMLLSAGGQLSEVYLAMATLRSYSPTVLWPHTTCANTGVVGNRRAVVMSIMNDVTPPGVEVARQAARTVRSLKRTAADPEVVDHLAEVLGRLEAGANDVQAVEQETEQLESRAAELAQDLKQASGVYVYTYPHYWRHPWVADSERRMFKIGRTTGEAWSRVVSQARQTGMPEDPLLLRVYTTDDPTTAEKTFHMLIDAAEHERSVGKAVGREWFVTTLEYCDAIAAALNLVVLRNDPDLP